MATLTRNTTRTSDGARSDALSRILKSYRSKISRYVVKGSGFSLDAVMGCSREELGDYIERNFVDDMSWENYGERWWFSNMESPEAYDMTEIEQFTSYFSHESFKPKFKEDVRSPFTRRGDAGLPVLKPKAIYSREEEPDTKKGE